MFAGRYENASDKPDRVSAPVKIRADCRLDFASGGGEKKPAAGFQQRNDSKSDKKNSGKNRPKKSPGKTNPETSQGKNHGQKRTGNRMPGQELLPGKNVHSIPLLNIRLFQGV